MIGKTYCGMDGGKEVERYGRVERKYFEMDGWKGSTIS
jgi:hypothetical protein